MFSARCLCSEKRRRRINGGKRNNAAHIISEINRMRFLGIRFLFYITGILIALCFFVIGSFGVLAVHLYFEQRS